MRTNESPFFVWRRGDGYVGCTRYDPRPRHSGAAPMDQFAILLETTDWPEARRLIVVERDAEEER